MAALSASSEVVRSDTLPVTLSFATTPQQNEYVQALPAGWKAIWHESYDEWYYLNIYAWKRQWQKPLEQVQPIADDIIKRQKDLQLLQGQAAETAVGVSHLKPYQYRPLDKYEFRILVLFSGKGDEPLRFRLVHHSTNMIPFYLAISYCWGESNVTHHCICDDEEVLHRSMTITDNLWKALKHFRREDEDLPIWADQICIDQSNLSERSEQVRLMDKIYGAAQQVLVWLGDPDTETARLFHFLEWADSKRWHIEQALAQRKDDAKPWDQTALFDHGEEEDWAAVRRLLTRPYFSRLWVFQEVVLANNPLIFCGGYFIPWDNLHFLYSHIENRQACLQDTGLRFDFMSTCRWLRKEYFRSTTDRTERQHSDLLNLMRHTTKLNCKLPEDKVFAVLGVANDVTKDQFEINYAMPYRTTYAKVTRFLVQQYRDLSMMEMLCVGSMCDGQDPYHRPRNLPSWVPDYSTYYGELHARLYNGPAVARHGAQRLYNATGLSETILLDDPEMVLSLRGISIGRIASVTGPGKKSEDGLDPHVLFHGEWHQFAKSNANDGVYDKTGEPIDVAYARLRVEDFWPDERKAADRRQRIASNAPLPEVMFVDLDTDDTSSAKTHAHDWLATRISGATKGRRLFVTDTGLLGIAHQSCLVGDEVYLFLGGDMPFVVRELETGTYHLQGDAYVHGVMDGEHLLAEFKDKDGRRAMMGDPQWLDSLCEEPLPFPVETITLS